MHAMQMYSLPTPPKTTGRVGPDVGGGLAEPARGAGPGRGAPDGAELLPRQAVGARDAAAQDAATGSLSARGVAPGGVDVQREPRLAPLSSGWPPKCLCSCSSQKKNSIHFFFFFFLRFFEIQRCSA